MPFWLTWVLIGTFVGTTVAYNINHSPSVAALNTPPGVEEAGNRSN